jgi:hypothetical protein
MPEREIDSGKKNHEQRSDSAIANFIKKLLKARVDIDTLHSTLNNWFLMRPSIATKFQYINSLLFSFSLATCFGPYGPPSGKIYN